MDSIKESKKPRLRTLLTVAVSSGSGIGKQSDLDSVVGRAAILDSSVLKNITMKALLAAVAVICLLSGCATQAMWTRFEPYSTQRLAPKPDTSQIPMSPGEPINRRYEKLGVVWSTWYTYEAAEKNVQKKAKEVGADAVINLRYTTYDVTVNYGTGSFIHTGALTTGTVASASYKDGYPLVAGIAVKFLGNDSEEIQFTNPNIVEAGGSKKGVEKGGYDPGT